MIKLKVQIEFDVEAESFAEAAEHKRNVNAIMTAVAGQYSSPKIEIKKLRSRDKVQKLPTHKLGDQKKGILSTYEEYEN